MLKRHIENCHEDQQTQEMRIRFACDICGFKTTSKVVLKTHTEMNHEQKENKKIVSKRKICNICNKKFNKESTFKNHMKNEHNQNKF